MAPTTEHTDDDNTVAARRAPSTTSKQRPKDRRAAFIRQASLPLDRHSTTNLPTDAGTQHEDTDAAAATHPPPLHSRWIHKLETAKGWKAFGAKDSRRIEASWRALRESGHAPQAEDKNSKEGEKEKDGEEDPTWSPLDPDDEVPVWKVPVGQDKLYDVDLKRLKMLPVFWKDVEGLEVQRASWFYESSQLKPCTDALADELETKFAEIQPWLASYTDELKSSLSLGAEAEAKLKCPIASLKNAYVIFQGPRLARLYTEDFTTRLSKQFFTAWSGEHGGGQLLVRGYQTLLQLQDAKKGGSSSSSSAKRGSRKSTLRRAAKRRSIATVDSAQAAATETEAEAEAGTDGEAVKTEGDGTTETVDDAKDKEASAKQVEVADGKRDDVEKNLKEALRTNDVLDNKEGAAVAAASNDERAEASSSDASKQPPTRSESNVSQITVSPSMTIDTAQATPSVDVSTAHANATPDSVKVGAGARLRSLALAASNRSAAATKNDLLRTVATRFGAWAGGADGAAGQGGESDNLSAKQREDIAASFREAQRRAQDLPASSDYETTDDEQHRDLAAEGEGIDGEDGESDAPVVDDPEEFDDAEEQLEDKEEELAPPELVLAIHGIGQRLAGDWKSFDFVLAINAFRELVQQRIDTSKPPSDIGGGGLKALADGRRLQLLPVLWRAGFHVEDDEEGTDKGEDSDSDDFDNGLELDMDHIFGNEGIPIVRTMTREVLMDIPMYLSHHKQHIVNSVRREANRQYRIFVRRNPTFEERGGRVHIIAHSLGSAIATEILSLQPTRVPLVKDLSPSEPKEIGHSRLLFNVEKFFAIGSPVGIWFVLNRAQLIARRGRECAAAGGASDEEQPPVVSLDQEGRYGCLSVSGFYNIANQFDPVGTRCTACVDVKYSKLVKPIPLSKATRAVLRTDEKAIAPDSSSSSKSAKKDAATSSTNATGTDAASSSKAAGSGGGSTFFSSWGRKAGSAARASSRPESSTATNEKGGEEPINKDHATSEDAESVAQDGTEPSKDRDGGSGPAAAGSKAASWLGAAGKAIQRRSLDRARAGDGDDEKAAAAGEDEDEDENGEDSKAAAAASTTHANEDGEDVRQRIRERAAKEEAKQRRREKEEEATAQLSVSSRRRRRAEARLAALNPMRRVDFYMPLEGYSLLSSINQYAELMTAHMSYWSRADLADFVVTQLLASEERMGRCLEFKDVEGWE